MKKGFWAKNSVAVIGAGSFGTVLANLAARNAEEVRLYVHHEDQARSINATRKNTAYLKDYELLENVKAFSDCARLFEKKPQALIWALPSKACRTVAREVAPFLDGSEIIIHATKGIEEKTLKRISVVLAEELPCLRIGMISGPNLATEIAAGQPAAAVIASNFEEVIEAGNAILSSDTFRIYGSRDLLGVEWAGTLKNILAIASGCLEALELGKNAQAMLLTMGLIEIVRFGKAMGSETETFLSLAGMGDLLATCSSELSRNFRVGYGLGKGKKLEEILKEIGSTAEGVSTSRIISQFARERLIEMPITQGVEDLLEGTLAPSEILKSLMARPPVKFFAS